MDGNPSRPPRHQQSLPLSPDPRRASVRQTYGSQRYTNQEALRGTVNSFHRANICSSGGQQSTAQQVETDRLSDGPETRHLRQARPTTNMGPPHPIIRPTSPRLRLPGRHCTPTSYQRPGLDRFLLPPQARRVLQGRGRHRPPYLPSMRPSVLHRTPAVQHILGLCKPSHPRPIGFCQPPLHHIK